MAQFAIGLLVVLAVVGWKWFAIGVACLVCLFVLLVIWGNRGSGDNSDNKPQLGPQIDVDASLRIKYQDAGGEMTTRDIHAHAYYPDGGHIQAHCSLRKQTRTFRIDRIKEAIDMETGEVVTGLRSYLRKHRLK